MSAQDTSTDTQQNTVEDTSRRTGEDTEQYPSDDEIAADLIAAATYLCKTPSEPEYEEYGEFSPDDVYRLVDETQQMSWEETLVVVVESNPQPTPVDKELRADVKRVADKVGEPLHSEEYKRHGVHSISQVREQIGDGSWRDALDTIGVEKQPGKIPADELREDVKQVANFVDSQRLTGNKYRFNGQYSPETVAQRLGGGSWITALTRLGFEDGYVVSEQTLLDDVKETATKLTVPLTTERYDMYGEYPPNVVIEMTGNDSWDDVLDVVDCTHTV